MAKTCNFHPNLTRQAVLNADDGHERIYAMCAGSRSVFMKLLQMRIYYHQKYGARCQGIKSRDLHPGGKYDRFAKVITWGALSPCYAGLSGFICGGSFELCWSLSVCNTGDN